MLILLPPSEGKATPRRGGPLDLDTLSFPELTTAREEQVAALVGLCSTPDPAPAAAVLGLGPTQTDEVRRNAGLRTAPTTRADRLYTGVLYDALGLATLDAAARRRATRRLLVFSALLGVVRPDDRLPSYRLGGGVTLPATGGVAAHWRSVLDPVLRQAAGTGLVVDLRSSTYAAFWRPDADLALRVVTVRVLQESDGRRSIVSHFNKATKGRLVRSLLESGATPRTPEQLAQTLVGEGFTVEPGPTSRTGRVLDVVVREL